MNAADITALIGGITALVVAVTGLVAVLVNNKKQNTMLAEAATQREEQAAKLEEVHVAVTGVPSTPIKAVEPPKPPPLPHPGTPGLPLVFLLVGIGAVLSLTPYALCGCNGGTGASSPARETARATVLIVADGVRAADVACAEVVKAGHPEVGKKCVDAYAIARPSIVSAGEAVDSWDAASSGKVGCSVLHALEALRSMQASIEGGGGRLPPAVTDAITFATGLGAIACPTGAS